MHKLIITAVISLLAWQTTAQTSAPAARNIPSREAPSAGDHVTESLTKFDLDFRGGTPRELVRAIEQASGIPLNAIIPEEHVSVRIPPLKMSQVNVAELFQALELASRKQVVYTTGFVDYGGVGVPRRQVQQTSSQFGFRTQGPPRDTSVWYFYYERPALLEETKACRFWQLEPYLTTYKVEDITTAVQTGYKLLGEPVPTISFHKDTKLLIAVGEADKLNLIDSVLKELRVGGSAQGVPTSPSLPTNKSEPAPK